MTAIISGALIHFYFREPHVLMSTLQPSFNIDPFGSVDCRYRHEILRVLQEIIDKRSSVSSINMCVMNSSYFISNI